MSSAIRPPSQDWATDFDHLDPRWSNDPYPIWAGLRETCAVAHTERFEGCYFPTTYAGIREVAYDTEHFSSRRFIVRDKKVEIVPAPPINADPPEHRPWKRAVLPPFTPNEIAKLEPVTRTICEKLIDAFPSGGCDVAELYARHVSVRVMAHLFGLPEQDGDLFRRWLYDILEAGITDPSLVLPTQREMSVYFAVAIAQRQANPTDDLITRLMHTTINGRPAEPAHVIGMLRLLLLAGIDTTWSAIGAALWHLAKHPDDAARLRVEPGLLVNRDRRAAAGLRPSIDRAGGGEGCRSAGVSDENGEHGAARLCRRQSRPGNVSRAGPGHLGPGREPACRLRAWHPPVRRQQPGSDGAHGSGGDFPAPSAVFPIGRTDPVGGRDGARPSDTADGVPLNPSMRVDGSAPAIANLGGAGADGVFTRIGRIDVYFKFERTVAGPASAATCKR